MVNFKCKCSKLTLGKHENFYKRLLHLMVKFIRKKWSKLLDNQHRRFHDLRHTYATRIFELGENAKTIQTILGHTDISVTLNTYTHVEESVSASAAERLNAIYNG